MPHLHNDIWCVTKEDLIPKYWNTYNDLANELWRYRDKNFGLDRVTLGGNGRILRVAFFSLPEWIQEEMGGDPTKADHILLNYFDIDGEAYSFYTSHKLKSTGKYIPKETQPKYIANACVLIAIKKFYEARIEIRENLKQTTRGVFKSIFKDCFGVNDFNPALMNHYKGYEHNLPSSYRRFKETYNAFFEGDMDFKTLIKDADRVSAKNAKVVRDTAQQAVLRKLLRKHNNFDNEQIKTFYNEVAATLDWKAITGSTVANYRTKWKLTTLAGSRGANEFNNKQAMQHKRKAPTYPLYYWTADGWDAELLYQKTSVGPKGQSVTTYHNRLNVVVVLDPSNKYPIGYAIGTHETPQLIRQAFRNAVKHTEELFGTKHKVQQLQTDRYAIKALTPFYQGVSKVFTPAKVKNSKSKVIEPWFNYLNKKYFQLMPNWSGFGVTSKKSNQPNDEYLNKIRHSFPDEMGCKIQIERAIEMERQALQLDYVKLYNEMPQEHKLYMDDESYLYHMGEITGHTNKMQGHGIVATLLDQKITFDSFDIEFRKQSFNDWCLKFDPEDTTKVLAVNATSHNGKLKEILGDHRFMLEQKHDQSMSIIEQNEENINALQSVNNFNKDLTDYYLDEQAADDKEVENLFRDNKLQGTLSKMILVDSTGQHKNNKSSARLESSNLKKVAKKQQKQAEKVENESWAAKQKEFVNKKVDVTEYL